MLKIFQPQSNKIDNHTQEEEIIYKRNLVQVTKFDLSQQDTMKKIHYQGEYEVMSEIRISLY